METEPLNKAIVTIINDSFWSEQDFIRINDDRHSMIYRVNVRTAREEEEHLIVCPRPHSIGQAECETGTQYELVIKLVGGRLAIEYGNTFDDDVRTLSQLVYDRKFPERGLVITTKEKKPQQKQ